MTLPTTVESLNLATTQSARSVAWVSTRTMGFVLIVAASTTAWNAGRTLPVPAGSTVTPAEGGWCPLLITSSVNRLRQIASCFQPKILMIVQTQQALMMTTRCVLDATQDLQTGFLTTLSVPSVM